MQKTNIKASILIWAIFLSLIISILFITVSIKINKNLKNNLSFSQQLETNNQIQNIINSGSIDGNYVSQYLNESEKIIFNANNKAIFGLKKGGTNISKIIENNNLSIKILSGGPIKYLNNTNSGIIDIENNISVTPGELKISNLGGYSKIEILSNVKTNKLTQFKEYKIYRDIGNKEVLKTNGLIKNF